MASKLEKTFLYEILSESDISELDLSADDLTVVSDAGGSDYDSASSYDSYDPSISTEDEEFIDDSNIDSDDSNDSYEPESATDTDDSDDSDEFESCSNYVGRDDTTKTDDCDSSIDESKQDLSGEQTSEKIALLEKCGNMVEYCVARSVSVKRPVTISCINFPSSNKSLLARSNCPKANGEIRGHEV
jgi:hypothetical protein